MENIKKFIKSKNQQAFDTLLSMGYTYPAIRNAILALNNTCAGNIAPRIKVKPITLYGIIRGTSHNHDAIKAFCKYLELDALTVFADTLNFTDESVKQAEAI